MKLTHLGAVATSILIAVGVVIVLGPAYLHLQERKAPPSVMLSFSVVNEANALEWCHDLASVLSKHQVKATVFVTGTVAEGHPECVRAFSEQGADVGSQTYSYVNLTTLSDYQRALEEVRAGKVAVDKAGALDSQVFKAPYGATDQNIYSLLSRSNITADFSYQDQYNKFEGGQFVKYDLIACHCLSSDEVTRLLEDGNPIMVETTDSIPVPEIEQMIVALKSENGIQFVRASELVGQELTAKRVLA